MVEVADDDVGDDSSLSKCTNSAYRDATLAREPRADTAPPPPPVRMRSRRVSWERATVGGGSNEWSLVGAMGKEVRLWFPHYRT